MITLEHVTKRIGNKVVIDDCNLVVQPNEAVCLWGPSGAGKTTLLELAAHIIKPSSGRVVLGSSKIGCAFQDDILIPWLDAFENIVFALTDQSSKAKDLAHYWLDQFGLPADKRPPEMSGGMKRRLNLARAFASEPDILFLDEPFVFLDEEWQLVTAQKIKEFISPEKAVLMVSHQREYLAEIGCRVVKTVDWSAE